MNSIILIFLFIGNYILVNSSKRVELRNNMLSSFAQNNKIFAQILSAVILILCLIGLFQLYGITSAICIWLFSNMCLVTLIVLLNPIKKIKSQYALWLLIMILVIEFISY